MQDIIKLISQNIANDENINLKKLVATTDFTKTLCNKSSTNEHNIKRSILESATTVGQLPSSSVIIFKIDLCEFMTLFIDQQFFKENNIQLIVYIVNSYDEIKIIKHSVWFKKFFLLPLC